MEVDRQVAAVLAKEPEIVAAWVFGSVARGTAREDSDLDVAILLRGPPPADATLYDVAARLEAAVSRPVDLVVLGDHDPIVAHRVFSEGRLVLDRDRDRRVEFQARSYMQYVDWAPTYEWAARRSLEVNRSWAGERR